MSASEVVRPLVRQFSKQIAGHSTEKGSARAGMLTHQDGSLLKPVLDPPRGPRELNFYEDVFRTNCTDHLLLELRTLLPQFRGVFRSDVMQASKLFLKLEDLTEDLVKPCILDVKIGARTYDPDASADKIVREQEKYKGTKVLGFCIPGMRVHRVSSNENICHGKDFGKKLDEHSVREALKCFLNLECRSSPAIVRGFLEGMNDVRVWFQKQTRYEFYASSLLLVYDAAVLTNDSSSSSCSRNGAEDDLGGQLDLGKLTRVKMIDFAHVFSTSSTDHNYLQGLNSLIGLFEDVLLEQTTGLPG